MNTLNSSNDFFIFTVAADIPIVLHWLEMGQITITGDANEEVLNLQLLKGVTKAGGASPYGTPTPLFDRAPGTSTTIELNSTIGTGGTVMENIPWNIRKAGPIWIPLPNARPRFGPGSNSVVFRVPTAPSSSITFSPLAVYEEL